MPRNGVQTEDSLPQVQDAMNKRLELVSIFLQSVLGIKNEEGSVDGSIRGSKSQHLRKEFAKAPESPPTEESMFTDKECCEQGPSSSHREGSDCSWKSPITIFSPESSVVYLIRKKATNESHSSPPTVDSVGRFMSPVLSTQTSPQEFPIVIVPSSEKIVDHSNQGFEHTNQTSIRFEIVFSTSKSDR